MSYSFREYVASKNFNYKKEEGYTFNFIKQYAVPKTAGLNGGKKGINDERLDNNLRRARRAINEILTLNLSVGHSFITLTYAENMQDYETGRIDFQNYIRSIGKPEYLRVIELQQRGAIHFHIIVFDIISDDILTNSWPWGRVHIEEIKDLNINAISNYFGKYVEDKLKGQLIDSNKKMYSTSRNVKRLKKVKASATDYYNKVDAGGLVLTNEIYNKVIYNK